MVAVAATAAMAAEAATAAAVAAAATATVDLRARRPGRPPPGRCASWRRMHNHC